MNEQPIYTQSQPIKPPKDHNILKTVAVVLLVIIALGGAGYSTYAWQQNNTLNSSITAKDSQITGLNKSLTDAKSTVSTTTPVATKNSLAIREFGVSITLPDSIKDVTYSYKSLPKASTAKTQIIGFSTKNITDLNRDGTCSAYTDPSLGSLEKGSGTFPNQSQAASPPTLVKQFATFYIAYNHPQSMCAENAAQSATVNANLSAFIEAIKSVKEL